MCRWVCCGARQALLDAWGGGLGRQHNACCSGLPARGNSQRRLGPASPHTPSTCWPWATPWPSTSLPSRTACLPARLQAYGRELDEAHEWCLKYKLSRKEAELHQAWDLYYHVFKRINKQLPSLTTLELQYVAPALVRAQVRLDTSAAGGLQAWAGMGRGGGGWVRGTPACLSCRCCRISTHSLHTQPHRYCLPCSSNCSHLPPLPPLPRPWVQGLELAVPGTYIAGEPLVTIAAFAPQLHVITSKQRPRKLAIHGSDGAEYMFLLKGHEDLRQDERVMQLFGLVNNMLSTDRVTAERDLSIARYAVIPLSPNSGLIGWVPNTDTLHALIREYRDARKIPLNVEHRLMLGMAPDYDHLTVIQKVEVFEHAMDSTSGEEGFKEAAVGGVGGAAEGLSRRAVLSGTGLMPAGQQACLRERLLWQPSRWAAGTCLTPAIHLPTPALPVSPGLQVRTCTRCCG